MWIRAWAEKEEELAVTSQEFEFRPLWLPVVWAVRFWPISAKGKRARNVNKHWKTREQDVKDRKNFNSLRLGKQMPPTARALRELARSLVSWQFSLVYTSRFYNAIVTKNFKHSVRWLVANFSWSSRISQTYGLKWHCLFKSDDGLTLWADCWFVDVDVWDFCWAWMCASSIG